MKRAKAPGSVWRSHGLLLAGAMLVSWSILGVGFRVFYDSVIPEVFLLVFSGFVFGVSNTTRRTGIALIGLNLGLWISERLFPAPAPAAHIARYGPPAALTFGGYLLLSAFPTVGTILGAVVRTVV
jgi:hypothetical protein